MSASAQYCHFHELYEKYLKSGPPPDDLEVGVPVLPCVREALQRGDKIEAIKLYREATGAGLAVAKAYVEKLQAGRMTECKAVSERSRSLCTNEMPNEPLQPGRAPFDALPPPEIRTREALIRRLAQAARTAPAPSRSTLGLSPTSGLAAEKNDAFALALPTIMYAVTLSPFQEPIMAKARPPARSTSS
jgi:hypothetical protein